jgi:hypothetical protein
MEQYGVAVAATMLVRQNMWSRIFGRMRDGFCPMRRTPTRASA